MKKAIYTIYFLFSVVCQAQYSDFAVEVVEAYGNFSDAGLYKDPYAMLGKPATRCRVGTQPTPTYRIKLVQPATNRSDTGEKVVTTISKGEYVIVKFDHRVVDYPGNPFGQDFIVFGNAFIWNRDTNYVDDAYNMNTLQLLPYAAAEPLTVSVSQGPADPNHPGDPNNWNWYAYENGPWADDLFPTQGYQWDRQNARWTDEEMDFTKPVNPTLQLSDFSGKSAADAIVMYDGSGGGTSFDLQDLPNYQQITADPNKIDPDTGYFWIQYVRIDGIDDILPGEIDAFSDVAVCGDPTHPFPAGDVNRDCQVDLLDLALLAGSWLECTYKCQ